MSTTPGFVHGLGCGVLCAIVALTTEEGEDVVASDWVGDVGVPAPC